MRVFPSFNPWELNPRPVHQEPAGIPVPALPLLGGMALLGALSAAMRPPSAPRQFPEMFGGMMAGAAMVAAGAVAAAAGFGLGLGIAQKVPPKRKIGPKDWSPRTGVCLCRKVKRCSDLPNTPP